MVGPERLNRSLALFRRSDYGSERDLILECEDLGGIEL